jgi:single-strand DNA-binding protein
MANLNKVMLIGRLTRDPETRVFANGGKVAKFGFAVNNRRRNSQTGQWEDEPVFVDVSAFNRESGRQLADLVEQSLRKGQQVFLEGHLVFEQWTDKRDGSKRSALRVVLDNLQFLEPRADGGGEGGRYQRGPAPQRAGSPSAPSGDFDEPIEHEPMDPPDAVGDDNKIPF